MVRDNSEVKQTPLYTVRRATDDQEKLLSNDIPD